jgi:GNAT superfamily N-acetyltransferase
MIQICRYTHGDFAIIRQILIDVHADAYADAMDDPFNQRFAWFVDHWGGRAGFDCIVGYDGEEPVGFAYGASSTPGKEVWRDKWAESSARNDTSTFFVSELMVRPMWRKTGASVRLHDALLDDRPEAIACLTVDATHPKVQALYESWGYFKVGEDQPFADSPLFAVMVKDLRGSQPTL